MKKLLTLAFTGILSTATFASSLVCSGERLYSSDVRRDSGVQPSSGMVTGTHVIMFDREILLSYDTVQGLFPHGAPPYRVTLEGNEKVLEEENHPAFHSKTFTATAVLHKVDSLSHEVIEEVGRDEVICRRSEKFVP